MTTSLTKLSLTQARDGLLSKDFSAVDLANAHLAAMVEKRNLNAFITETPELALSQAEASDKRLASGNAGALEGLPVAHVVEDGVDEMQRDVNIYLFFAFSNNGRNSDEKQDEDFSRYFSFDQLRGIITPWSPPPCLA